MSPSQKFEGRAPTIDRRLLPTLHRLSTDSSRKQLNNTKHYSSGYDVTVETTCLDDTKTRAVYRSGLRTREKT